jgi:organic hydroperoxide reductase OsmC/OhrA
MAAYTAVISWERGDQPFVDRHYSRAHAWRFDGGIEVPASASPHVVRSPYSTEAAIDPEEAFVASLSSCHMLWFLDIAARSGFRVDRYVDNAEGIMGKNAEGRMAMTLVTLRPEVSFSGEKIPSREELDGLHHEAHEACFIASSVKTEVRCEPSESRSP